MRGWSLQMHYIAEVFFPLKMTYKDDSDEYVGWQ